MSSASQRIVDILKSGGVGVLPTDTIYGIVSSALNPEAVRRIYKLRRRNPKKPMIILIGSLRDLGHFGVRPDKKTLRFLKAIWFYRASMLLFSNSRELENRPTSVVLPIDLARAIKKFKYLHRGIKTLAFRLPKPMWLRKLLGKTGPLVAPSANWEGEPLAYTIKEAKKYFGGEVDFYVDTGRLFARPSTLIAISSQRIKVLRGNMAKII